MPEMYQNHRVLVFLELVMGPYFLRRRLWFGPNLVHGYLV